MDGIACLRLPTRPQRPPHPPPINFITAVDKKTSRATYTVCLAYHKSASESHVQWLQYFKLIFLEIQNVRFRTRTVFPKGQIQSHIWNGDCSIRVYRCCSLTCCLIGKDFQYQVLKIIIPIMLNVFRYLAIMLKIMPA